LDLAGGRLFRRELIGSGVHPSRRSFAVRKFHDYFRLLGSVGLGRLSKAALGNRNLIVT
jgi:hypothetical protein